MRPPAPKTGGPRAPFPIQKTRLASLGQKRHVIVVNSLTVPRFYYSMWSPDDARPHRNFTGSPRRLLSLAVCVPKKADARVADTWTQVSL